MEGEGGGESRPVRVTKRDAEGNKVIYFATMRGGRTVRRTVRKTDDLEYNERMEKHTVAALVQKLQDRAAARGYASDGGGGE